jgi:hypothetical protein
VSDPALLSRSLTKRYKPRLIACRRMNEESIALLKTSSHTDIDFCKRIKLPLEELHEIAANVALAEKEKQEAEDSARLAQAAKVEASAREV